MSVVLRHQISGATDAPTVVLGPSLGTTRDVWQPQVAALSTRWRIVAFDLPGHGGTPDPDRPISVEDLAGGVIALLDRLRVQTFGYCGLSLGGAIGQVLGARYAERIPALVLCCTSAR